MQVTLDCTDDHFAYGGRGAACHHGLQQLEGGFHGASGHKQLRHESLAILEALTYIAHGAYHLAVDELLRGDVLCYGILSGRGGIIALAV